MSGDDKLVCRYATDSDIRMLYPQGMQHRMRAMVVEKDGLPIGIGGIIYRPEANWCFLEERNYEEHGLSRLAVARAIFKCFKEMVEPEAQNLFIYRDISKPTSERLLTKLGFTCTFKDGNDEMWQMLAKAKGELSCLKQQ